MSIMRRLFQEKLHNKNICFRSRGLASGIAAAGSYMLAFLASKTFLSLKSALGLHGVFWLYGVLGFVGFFAIYWTFSETEGRSLEEIEEFYKQGIRGKIPKKGITEEVSKESSINFSPSTSSATTEREGVSNSNDEDRMIINTLFTTQQPRTKARKSRSSNDISGGAVGMSTETIDTTFTVSTVDLQEPKSTTGDVREKKDDVKQTAEETPKEVKVAEEERDTKKDVKGSEIKDPEGTLSEHKSAEGKSDVDNEDKKCIQEK